jgi:hypothetical protein
MASPGLGEVGGILKAQKKAACAAFFIDTSRLESALAGLETRVALADHERLAATAHNLAVTVPLLGGLQRGKHLHGQLLKQWGNTSAQV